jgi:hypothetical protein
MERGKGVVIKLGSNEIQLNKMEGTGLFAGSGNLGFQNTPHFEPFLEGPS